ncbi:MAG TPA: MerR family transcriptional regulator [Azospirillaceae bacterium]|nr:MerR family transcriptional regulator [Azospirillaceae bacterium]HRQ80609.1 MerR family transcriptional regulator [Azospirillaceae bacterium]
MPAGGHEKAATAYRTISEVAEELDVPQHVLRFWETRFPQIRPRKGAGGRRYYRPTDIDLLRRIRKLLYDDGFTIRGAQMALREMRKPVSVPALAAPISAPISAPAAPPSPAPTGPAPTSVDVKTRELQGVLEELRALRRSLPNPS